MSEFSGLLTFALSLIGCVPTSRGFVRAPMEKIALITCTNLRCRQTLYKGEHMNREIWEERRRQKKALVLSPLKTTSSLSVLLSFVVLFHCKHQQGWDYLAPDVISYTIILPVYASHRKKKRTTLFEEASYIVMALLFLKQKLFPKKDRQDGFLSSDNPGKCIDLPPTPTPTGRD